MKESDKDNHELGERIDVKVGSVYPTKPSPRSDKSCYEEKMLMMMKKQTEDISRIKNIVTFFFALAVIAIAYTLIIIQLAQ